MSMVRRIMPAGRHAAPVLQVLRQEDAAGYPEPGVLAQHRHAEAVMPGEVNAEGSI